MSGSSYTHVSSVEEMGVFDCDYCNHMFPTFHHLKCHQLKCTYEAPEPPATPWYPQTSWSSEIRCRMSNIFINFPLAFVQRQQENYDQLHNAIAEVADI
jgi:hypothetical protein